MSFGGVDVAEIGRGVVWFDAENIVQVLRLIANFRALTTLRYTQQNNTSSYSRVKYSRSLRNPNPEIYLLVYESEKS